MCGARQSFSFFCLVLLQRGATDVTDRRAHDRREHPRREAPAEVERRRGEVLHAVQRLDGERKVVHVLLVVQRLALDGVLQGVAPGDRVELAAVPL